MHPFLPVWYLAETSLMWINWFFSVFIFKVHLRSHEYERMIYSVILKIISWWRNSCCSLVVAVEQGHPLWLWSFVLQCCFQFYCASPWSHLLPCLCDAKLRCEIAGVPTAGLQQSTESSPIVANRYEWTLAELWFAGDLLVVSSFQGFCWCLCGKMPAVAIQTSCI